MKTMMDAAKIIVPVRKMIERRAAEAASSMKASSWKAWTAPIGFPSVPEIV